MTEIRYRLDEQDWQCAYRHPPDDPDQTIYAGDDLARAYDNYGVIHLRCAKIGEAPIRLDKPTRARYDEGNDANR
jgi:hypothetical protein